MKSVVKFAVPALALALLAACSSAPSAPTAQGPVIMKGDTLMTADGEALFFNVKDTVANKSACVRDCLKVYKPLFASPDDKGNANLAVIERTDGMAQWSYKGKPLYTCPDIRVIKDDAKTRQAVEKRKADCAAGLKGDWSVAKH